ncbi:PA0069 family radical SAM protein [Marimonas arenosa]|uniref:PA0069 family radical SAM protein n=1 Tax=Marimonas arenosa TaxID=1795305 RepID=A0AAE3W898_9RHOB|nr:PA0069 family radical SAM protein [Marimonas arenosa]MDQ2088456.1 PA0069 family radical SAM protein [Marimonas arenosa]
MEIAKDDRIAPERRRARGAVSNTGGRFEAQTRQAACDGWDIPEPRPGIETELRVEWARSLITYNRSPDLPFDRSINPYRGCEHGCVYCFARPSHAYLGLSPGLDFETRLVAKANAPDVLRRELSARHYRPAPIAIGTNTDPYQPVEQKRKMMRACLKVLAEFRHPVAIVTKGTMIERDLDILAPMARDGLVRVGLSVTTLDPALARRMEPRAPVPARRLATIRALSRAGVPVRLMVSPIVPGLTDHEIEAILAAGHEAGANAASWIMLRLPLEVSSLWREWLEEHYPARAGRVMARLREMHGGKDYDARWGHRMRGQGHYAEMTGARFRMAARRLALDARQPDLRCDLFRVPSDQMTLF